MSDKDVTPLQAVVDWIHTLDEERVPQGAKLDLARLAEPIGAYVVSLRLERDLAADDIERLLVEEVRVAVRGLREMLREIEDQRGRD